MLNVILWVLLIALSGILYYIGGASKEECKKVLPFVPSWFVDTRARDAGCPACAITILGLLFGWHWSLILVYGLMWLALSTYWKKKGDDAKWYNWLMTGFAYGLAFILYVWNYQHNWFGLVLLIVFITYTTMWWSELCDGVIIEASGRGALIILLIPLLDKGGSKMILQLILLVIIALVLPLIINLIKAKLKIADKFQPLLPLAAGIIIGVVLFFFPVLNMTLREGVFFGLAAGGLSTILYDLIKGLKLVAKK